MALRSGLSNFCLDHICIPRKNEIPIFKVAQTVSFRFLFIFYESPIYFYWAHFLRQFLLERSRVDRSDEQGFIDIP